MNYDYCFVANYKDLSIWRKMYYNFNGSVRRIDYEVRPIDEYNCILYVGSSFEEVLHEIEEMV